MAEQVLVFIEHNGNKIGAMTTQLIARGRDQSNKLNTQLSALILGHQVDQIVHSVSKMDIDAIFVAEDPCFEDYNPEIFIRAVTDILKEVRPKAVLLGDTFITREIGPAIAHRLSVPFLSSCVDIEITATKIIVTQPKYGGVIYAEAELEPVPATIMVSLQNTPGIPEALCSHTPAIISLKMEMCIQGLRTKLVSTVQAGGVETDITKADILVAGGRGLGTKENITLIKQLAEALGGVIACSRPLWDIGWLSECYVVGMSGKTVSPNIYLACGISGASQHLVGMSGSKCVIAINKDANAPIFRVAHYAVVGDLRELLPLIIDEARKLKIAGKRSGGD